MADPINVAYLNESTLITDAEIAPFIAAYQADINQYGHLWALGTVTLRQIPKGQSAPSGWRQQVWLDNTDQANALGYHELTSEGLGLGKIFVGSTQRDGQTPSRVGSHELWEMLVDEGLNRYTDPMDGRRYAIEVGDLTSLDSQGRQGLGGVLLSDIALPATYWPNGGYPPQYSIGGSLTAPLPNVAPAYGAYLMWQGGGAGWAGGAGAATAPFSFQAPPVTNPADFMHFQPQFGSRRHRRIIGEANWRRSTVPVVDSGA